MFGFQLVKYKDYKEMIKEFLLYPTYEEKGVFVACRGLFSFVGVFGGEEQ